MVGCFTGDVVQNATPLLYACIQGFQMIVDKLVAEGATVDPDVAIVYNPKHDVVGPLTPLAAAAANGYEHIVRKLLSAGARIDRTLVPSQQEKKVTVKESSVKRFEPDALNSPLQELPYAGATALSIACAMGQTTVVQSLLAASADVRSVAMVATFRSMLRTPDVWLPPCAQYWGLHGQHPVTLRVHADRSAGAGGCDHPARPRQPQARRRFHAQRYQPAE